MSDNSTSARPRQVTMASGFAVGGSLFLLLTVFETLGRLPTVAMREQVGEALDSGSAEALGLSVDQALSVMRVALSVAAVCAAIALVAGVFCFQRHRGARVALSVAAVPLLLTAPFTGGLLAVLVVVAAGLLWSGPARDWFAGRPVREVPDRRRPDPPEDSSPGPDEQPGPPPAAPRPPADRHETTAAVSTLSTSTAPAPTHEYGAPATSAQRPADPSAPGGPWSATAPVADRPPVAVRVACVLTWVSSTLVALSVLALITVYQLDRDALRPTLYRELQLDPDQVPPELLTPTLWVTALLFAGWALGACLLAWFVRRRHDWARYLLAISAGISGLVCLLSFPVGLPSALAAGVTIGLLFRREARDWFAGRAPAGGAPPSRRPRQPW